MKQTKLDPAQRFGGFIEAEYANEKIDMAIQEINDLVNYLAQMNYFVLFDTETISDGDGFYFTQIKNPYFYDKADEVKK